ncbi:hypothetical protein Vafri_18306 [Volvox africanus]|uniref:Glycosyl transferase CAP10 domain-containing protein n=1 Tax=Volvox africanus TaxID=51714 RepID=A0A8J4FBN0_9CHLO|nr:hypothetical protein Vafri_18306 [Volvox africanus]
MRRSIMLLSQRSWALGPVGRPDVSSTQSLPSTSQPPTNKFCNRQPTHFTVYAAESPLYSSCFRTLVELSRIRPIVIVAYDNMMPVTLGMDGITIFILSAVIALSCYNYTEATASVLPNIQVEQVTSEFNVPGGYFAPQFTDHSPRIRRAKPSCYEFSRSILEPYSERYLPKASLPSITDGSVPRAFWRWSGNITRADFQRAKSRRPCEQCFLNHYRFQSGRLFIEKGASLRVPQSRRLHQLAWEEMLSIVLYLYPKMPDMEFLWLWDDECVNGLPVFAPNACRQFAKAGFTLPSFSVWSQSLGQVQMAAYHSCIWNRYPPHERKPLAVWRGSTTGARKPTLENYQLVTRLKLHLLAQNYSDILDAKINKLTKDIPEPVRARIKLGDRLDSEDYNRYSAIIDVDGNGWSDRFGHALIHYSTPVLKMASNHTAFFEHLFAPGVTFLQFSPSLEDLVGKAGKVVSEVRKLGGQSKYFDMVKSMQATSQVLMDHLGLMEALAYSLLKYWSLVTWTLGDLDPDPDVDLGHRNHLDPSIAEKGNQRAGGGGQDGDGGGGEEEEDDDHDTKTAAESTDEMEGFEEVAMTCCSLTHVPAEFATAVTTRLLNKAPGRR